MIQPVLFLFLPFLRVEEIAEPIKVFFHDDTNTLCVKARFGEVAIIRLVVNL